MNKEVRAFNCEMRADYNEERGKFIEGVPIVVGEPTDMGWYTEIIERGALDDTDFRDVRLLVNHNTDMIPLARSRNNNENSTMQLKVGNDGNLHMRANLDTDNNADARSLHSATGRGDISGMSFMFGVDKDMWDDPQGEHPVRHILSIQKVYEVSAVTWPAYEQTSLEARGLGSALDSAKSSLDSAKAEAERISKEKRDAINRIKILAEVTK